MNSFETFYAIDVKYLAGSTLSRFAIEYSTDGRNFKEVQQFKVHSAVAGSVATYYFKPVYAKFIRIVVK